MNELPLTARSQPIAFQREERYGEKEKNNHLQFGRGVTQSDLKLYASDLNLFENFFFE